MSDDTLYVWQALQDDVWGVIMAVIAIPEGIEAPRGLRRLVEVVGPNVASSLVTGNIGTAMLLFGVLANRYQDEHQVPVRLAVFRLDSAMEVDIEVDIEKEDHASVDDHRQN